MRGGWLFFLAALVGCAAPVRRGGRGADGAPALARTVDARALAAYARARHAETLGDRSLALAEYSRVLELDPRSSEAWARIGALRCADDPDGARDAFERAAALAPHDPQLLRDRATCALTRGDSGAALRDARAAAEAEPGAVASTLVYARALEASGDAPAARRWLEGLVVREPTDRAGWLALLALAERQEDVGLARRARGGAARAGANTAPEAERDRARDALDRAIVAWEIDAARAAAARAGINEAGLALRALALGRPALGADAASLALAADPSDPSAWIAALVAASLEGDRGAVEQVAAQVETEPAPLEPLAVALFFDLLDREVGGAAASAWLDAQPALEPGDDPVVRVMFARLRASAAPPVGAPSPGSAP